MIVKSVEKKENNVVRFAVTADPAEFEAAVNGAYLKSKKNIYVPGFRKGKAPRMVVEGMYGTDVFYEDAVNDLAPKAFQQGVESESLRTVGTPSLADTEFGEDKSVTMTFETALYPEVTLGEYKNLEAPKADVAVTDDEVQKELERLQKRNSRLITVDRPAKEGDTAVIDFEGFIDGVAFEGGKGEGHNLVLGSGAFIPGFEEQVVGMSAGEEKDIQVKFPEDYHADLAGKDAVFKVKVDEVKETELPELDDEFAKDVSEFDTLEAYKDSIRENLKSNKESQAEEHFHNALLEKAVENMTVDIPDAMVEERLDSLMEEYARNMSMQGLALEQYLQMMGMDFAAFRSANKSTALRQVQAELLLEAVAKAEDFTFTPEEIEAEYQRVADNYGVDLEMVKKNVSEENLVADMKMSRAAKLIYDTGIPTEMLVEVPDHMKEEAGEAAGDGEEKPKAKKTTRKKAEPKEAPAEETGVEAEEAPKPKKTRAKAKKTETEPEAE